MKDDTVYLRHVLECIRRIEEFTSTGKESLLASDMRQDAVLRNLQTMSESTQRLSATTRDAHPAVDWRAISAFRNVLVQNYPGIDLEQIWIIVRRDVPGLRDASRSRLEAITRGR